MRPPPALPPSPPGPVAPRVQTPPALAHSTILLILTPSDATLKTDVKRVGTSAAGVPRYTFRYRDDPSRTLYSGTIAQELRVDPRLARAAVRLPAPVRAVLGRVVPEVADALWVDYAALDVPFCRRDARARRWRCTSPRQSAFFS